MSSDSLKKMEWETKGLTFIFCWDNFSKILKKKTKSKEKTQLIYKTDCSAIDFLLNIE